MFCILFTGWLKCLNSLKMIKRTLHFLNSSILSRLCDWCTSRPYWTLMHYLLVIKVWTYPLWRFSQINFSNQITLTNWRSHISSILWLLPLSWLTSRLNPLNYRSYIKATNWTLWLQINRNRALLRLRCFLAIHLFLNFLSELKLNFE